MGSASVNELIAAGHRVLGRVRSDPGAQALKAAGATPLRGALADLNVLRAAAAHTRCVLAKAPHQEAQQPMAAGSLKASAAHSAAAPR